MGTRWAMVPGGGHRSCRVDPVRHWRLAAPLVWLLPLLLGACGTPYDSDPDSGGGDADSDGEGAVDPETWVVTFDVDIGTASGLTSTCSDDVGDVLVAGCSTYVDPDLYVAAVDKHGAVVWYHTISGVNCHYPSIVSDGTGGVFVACTTEESDVWVARLDHGGTLAWQQTIGGPLEEGDARLFRRAGGELLLAAYTSSFGDGDADAWLIAFDDDGTVLWQRRYGRDGTYENGPIAIQETGEGQLVFLGHCQNPPGGIAVVSLDDDGSIAWQRVLRLPGIGIGANALVLVDDGFMIAGGASPDGGNDLWIAKIDLRGELQWQWTYPTARFGNAVAAIPRGDGGILVLGQEYIVGGDARNRVLLSIDPDGSTVWQRFVGDDHWDSPTGLALMDNTIVVTGSTRDPSGETASPWVARLDPNGDIAGACRQIEPADLSPTPTTAFGEPGDFELSVTDAVPAPTAFTATPGFVESVRHCPE